MTRSFWVSLHRWAGLSMAGFLILVGLTGSLLAFGHELNHWLTPNLYPGPHAG
ncbi:PepSY domain-containing protein, partial [Methylocystis suflitae]